MGDWRICSGWTAERKQPAKWIFQGQARSAQKITGTSGRQDDGQYPSAPLCPSETAEHTRLFYLEVFQTSLSLSFQKIFPGKACSAEPNHHFSTELCALSTPCYGPWSLELQRLQAQGVILAILAYIQRHSLWGKSIPNRNHNPVILNLPDYLSPNESFRAQ